MKLAKCQQNRRFIIAQFCGLEGQHGENISNVTAVFQHGGERIDVRLTEDQFKTLRTCKVGELIKINTP